MELIPQYYVGAHLDEDGFCQVSGFFTSRRKAGRWLYSRKWLLEAKQTHERVIGRITGMDEEMNMDDHVARAIRVTRADIRRGPRGCVCECTVEEQQEMMDEMRDNIF